MYNPQITAERIKQRAKEQSVSMTQLSEICGINKNAIAQAGKSQEGMKAKNIYAIAEVLQCSVDYLLGRTDDPAKSADMYTFGDNNGIQAVNNSSVAIEPIPKAKHPEGMEEQFMHAFSELELEDKIAVMSFTMERIRKGA